MRVTLAILFICINCVFCFSQTVFWTETFDGSNCVAGSGCDPSIVSWNSVSLGGEGANANRWYVSDREDGNSAGACGSAGSGDQSLHVGNVSTSAAAGLFCPSGDCGAAYDDSGTGETTNKRVESPTINCTGYNGITVDFNYIEDGEGIDDDASFWYYNGSTWSNLDPIAKSSTGCAPQGLWTAVTSISLPASADNNPNVKVGFLWVNDGDGSASDPSFAVDDITLSYATSLPIGLLYFNGKQINNEHIRLEWVTESEINNDYFTLERSLDGEIFEPISTKEGAGNSNTNKYYSEIDYSPPKNQQLYYRLKQTDFNGDFSYSSIISLVLNNGIDITHRNNKLNIYSANSSIIEIYDISGKLVYSNTFLDEENINTSEFNSGIYILKIIGTNNTLIRKLKF